MYNLLKINLTMNIYIKYNIKLEIVSFNKYDCYSQQNFLFNNHLGSTNLCRNYFHIYK